MVILKNMQPSDNRMRPENELHGRMIKRNWREKEKTCISAIRNSPSHKLCHSDSRHWSFHSHYWNRLAQRQRTSILLMIQIVSAIMCLNALNFITGLQRY